MSDLHVWQRLDTATSRLRVPGGWLYTVTAFNEYGNPCSITSCFIPDPMEERVEMVEENIKLRWRGR